MNGPLDGEAYVVCAFQMLEHVPYEKSLAIFREMARVARKGAIISLPDAAERWPMAIHIPLVGLRWISIPKPRIGAREHQFDGEHYWEINKAGYSLARVQYDLSNVVSMKMIRNYRVGENPYHRFFVFRKL
ncbi:MULTISPECIES: class I SAM-dependent methyltransferase [unclassified Thioalkalivibrio]|uniref:class I SAM-dependent methyltransferase n=1 Tax=unclassified Thioalkalivibrio TaxID=2621013 RepID=UPI0018CAFE37|nr:MULTISPECIES: class I SAM-dependent methyltransferase [unclassified Thioalkalivibrio]